jgi:hypothetical protein
VTVSDVRNVSEARGSVLVSFLHGMAVEEWWKDELEELDPAYELVVAVRALEHGTSP